MKSEIMVKKIKLFLKKIFKFSIEHIFLTFLGLLVLALMISGFVFYQYVFLVQKIKPQAIERPLQFKEKVFQEILIIWQEREKRFKETDFKEYPDFFSKKEKRVLEIGQIEIIEEERIIEEEIIPELPLEPKPLNHLAEPLDFLKKEKLQAAITLEEFYKIKEERLPSIKERAKIWQEKKLGLAEEYFGTHNQNIRLLNELKNRL